jgi:hypothetical protein
MRVREVIGSLDGQHRWLSKHEWISRPYAISASGEETNTAPFSTEGGAAIKDSSDQQYISTQLYVTNMEMLNSYLMSVKKRSESPAPKSYSVGKMQKQPQIDGNWHKKEWKNSKPLAIQNYMGNIPAFRPAVQSRMAYDDQHLYVIFKVEDRYVRSVTTATNGPVWRDSAVEFFFSPEAAHPENYFNLEINCGGTLLMHFNDRSRKKSISLDPEDLKQIAIAHSLPKTVDPEMAGPVTWTIECRIPFSLLTKYAEITKPSSGVKWRGNFYKIAENSSNPHYITWSQIDQPKPNFHVPESFGTLEFK